MSPLGRLQRVASWTDTLSLHPVTAAGRRVRLAARHRGRQVAGAHCFNGNGEMTGLAWIDEQGLISAPIGITNTYSLHLVRDAICAPGGARQGAAAMAPAGGGGDL